MKLLDYAVILALLEETGKRVEVEKVEKESSRVTFISGWVSVQPPARIEYDGAGVVEELVVVSSGEPKVSIEVDGTVYYYDYGIASDLSPYSTTIDAFESEGRKVLRIEGIYFKNKVWIEIASDASIKYFYKITVRR